MGMLLAADEKKPPSINYPASRSSSTWVETPTGQVAVDEGIEWQGIKLYLSLTWDLVAVDVKTNKTLWSQNVSAFWNSMAIKEVEPEPGKKVWAVELRPRNRDRGATSTLAYHELQTGKEIKLPGQIEKPSGKALALRKVYSGDQSNLGRGFWLIVSKPENWTKVRERMFAGLDKASAPLAKDIDFGKEVVLVVSMGDSWNCRGLECAEAYEDEKRILIREHASTFQTAGPGGGGVRCRPYGIFLLPRAQDKAYVLERNRQSYKGGPSLWTEQFRAERLPDPAKELERLP
jgi:hypothetical protein